MNAPEAIRTPSTVPRLADVSSPQEIFPGIWRLTVGTPEKITPVRVRSIPPAAARLASLTSVATCPIVPTVILGSRGPQIRVPLAAEERIYGLGLQLQSFEQRGRKKLLRVNADPAMDTGDSHAPVPFYVTTRGYGIYVDTARYATFCLGNTTRAPQHASEREKEDGRNDGWNGVPPYEQKGLGLPSEVSIEVPGARGIDVYIFAGPSLREAVQRYNLFAGGGPVPPRWGLGFWYRAQTDFSQAEVLNLAAEFRERRIPCDVIGLEPHWQSHSYSCSFQWGHRFPQPRAMLESLKAQHFRVNLWEHAFTHPSSPIYPALLPHAGDQEVWGGIVPDFLDAKAQKIFADHHARAHVELGVSGYKLDECDNSDFTGNWSFPESSRFPSGADGEQMHSLIGQRYQETILSIFDARRERTYGLVRASGALATPYPFVLYSDLYRHAQFVHAVAQAGFSGLLWTPEVRDASGGTEELVRRLQAAAFSPLAMINAWYLKHPPWKQVERAANNAGVFASDWESAEAQCRAVIELRMRLIPYLHAAFVRYQREGLPPFRALVMEYPDDPAVYDLSDQYLMGDRLLVAPIIVGDRREADLAGAVRALPGVACRTVYLPAGAWCDFWTGERLGGQRRIEVNVPLDRIPLYVKANSVLPLAQPTLHTDDPQSWRLTALVYGDGREAALLFEDAGDFEPSLSEVRVEWHESTGNGRLVPQSSGAPMRYEVTAWERRGC